MICFPVTIKRGIMPIYSYECCSCEARQDAYRPLKDHALAPECAECGGESKQIITQSYQVGTDYPEYINAIDRTPIRGKRQHREFLKRNDCVEYGYTGEY